MKNEKFDRVIENLPAETYFQAPGISASGVKCFYLQSPKHYYYRYIMEEYESKRTEALALALALGSMVHCLVLEPDEFESRYKKEADIADYENALVTLSDMKNYCDEHQLKTSGTKKELSERIKQHDASIVIFDDVKNHNAENETREIINSKLFDKARRMRDSVLENPGISKLFEHGRSELSVFSEHEITQDLIKCRCDYYRDDGIIIDLKTCSCSSPDYFSKSCANYGYGLQQAHYLHTVNMSELPANGFLFVAVESEYPFIAQIYELDFNSSQITERLYHNLMKKINEATTTKIYKTYTDDTLISLPAWHQKQIRDFLND